MRPCKHSAVNTLLQTLLALKDCNRVNYNHVTVVQVSYGYIHHCSSLLLLARYLSLLICCLPSLPTNRRSSPFINKPTGIL